MGYKKAEEVLPMEVIEMIQQYVDGESLYIPRRKDRRQGWGAGTKIRQELEERNSRIFEDYRNGNTITGLGEKYFLSEKSIRRILQEQKYKQENCESV